MASKNKAILPPVPKTADREMANFLRAVRENAEIIGGKGRSDPLDRAITFRDWREANGSSSLTNGSGIIIGGSDDDTVRYNDIKPLIPTGVEVYPTFERVLCRWDRVSSDWYFATEIFRLIVVEPEEGVEPEELVFPQFVDATQVGTVMSPFFTDSIASGTTAVYWIRHLNRDGEAGPVHDPDGTQVTTYRKPLDVLTEYSKEIYAGANYEWLRSDMSMMHAVNSAFQAGGLAENSGLSQALSRSGDLSDLLAELSLQNSLDKQQSSYEFQAQFGKNYARLSGGVHAAVGSLESYITRIGTMESNWVGLDGVIESKIETFELSLSGEAGAVATSITNHTVDYNGVEVTLQELASASATEAEGYEAQWGVKSSIAGLQGGVGFLNDGLTTSFIVDAQTFAVTNGTGDDSTVLPFVITDGSVHMATAMIDTAVIYTLIAQNITAETVVAAVELSSPLINGGTITGTTLNINDKTTISASGLLVTENAVVHGEINAESGTLDNVTIKDTCEIQGVLSAANIEGDVLDRSVIVIRDTFEFRSGVLTLAQGDIVPGVVGPVSDRVLVVSGMSFDHQNAAGSVSYYKLELLLDGEVVHTYNAADGEEDSTDSPQLGCRIPSGETIHSFAVRLTVDANSLIMVRQSAMTIDVFKVGSTIQNLTSMHFSGESVGGEPPLVITGVDFDGE